MQSFQEEDYTKRFDLSLIFDDSLSAVDTETDAQIRAALSSEQKDVTTLIISHRVTTLSQADMILVLEDGHLVGCGTHDALLRDCAVYREIYDSQFASDSTKGGDAS